MAQAGPCPAPSVDLLTGVISTSNGNIAQEVIGGANSATNTFGCDDLYRLSSATRYGTNYTWTYDAVGNRLSQTAGAITTNYTYL